VLTFAQRDWALLLAIAIGFCVAFLVEPDWNLQEAHRLCAGEPVEIFESITACSVNMPAACPCVRPYNPWVIVYWLVFLLGVGTAAALLLRVRALLMNAVFLVGAMVAGGYSGFLLLSRRELFEPEAWAYAPLVLSAYIAITLVAFGLTRLARHLLVNRRSAT
jgi:hypothetical protein